jgi:hypothetical protein
MLNMLLCSLSTTDIMAQTTKEHVTREHVEHVTICSLSTADITAQTTKEHVTKEYVEHVTMFSIHSIHHGPDD